MKLEFFEDGLDGEPLILLYGGSPDEVDELRRCVGDLAAGIVDCVSVHDLPFVQPLNDMQLRAFASNADLGVRAVGPAAFDWIAEPSAWSEVKERLEPFAREPVSDSFQYLNEAGGPEVIYSSESR